MFVFLVTKHLKLIKKLQIFSQLFQFLEQFSACHVLYANIIQGKVYLLLYKYSYLRLIEYGWFISNQHLYRFMIFKNAFILAYPHNSHMK